MISSILSIKGKIWSASNLGVNHFGSMVQAFDTKKYLVCEGIFASFRIAKITCKNMRNVCNLALAPAFDSAD